MEENKLAWQKEIDEIFDANGVCILKNIEEAKVLTPHNVGGVYLIVEKFERNLRHLNKLLSSDDGRDTYLRYVWRKFRTIRLG